MQKSRLGGRFTESVIEGREAGDITYTQAFDLLEALSVSSDDIQEKYNPLEHGRVNTEDDRVLLKNQEQLNEYLTQVFSDVKAVHYQLTANENGLTYELILTKQIDGELIDIPISQESTGTRKLLSIFPYLFRAARGNTVVIDAIDQGVRELLMLEVLEALKDSLKGQLIVTTHNTLLLKEMKPEEAYIVVIDAKGHKEIRCITDYREPHKKPTTCNINTCAEIMRGFPM